MGNKLRPGNRGSPAEVGTPGAFANSMAQTMEDELNKLLEAEGRPKVPLDNSAETRDRRMMFIAIARGVVRHLRENQAAFRVVPEIIEATIEIKTDE